MTNGRVTRGFGARAHPILQVFQDVGGVQDPLRCRRAEFRAHILIVPRDLQPALPCLRFERVVDVLDRIAASSHALAVGAGKWFLDIDMLIFWTCEPFLQ